MLIISYFTLHLKCNVNDSCVQMEDGRVSAVEMLHSLFNSLVQSALEPVALTAVIRLSSRIVSESSERPKAMVAMALMWVREDECECVRLVRGRL